MPKSIADTIRDEADRRLHADFIFHAKFIVAQYQGRAPRIDNGEWWVDCEREINAYREVFSEQAGVQLRNLSLELIHGECTPVIEPRQ